MFEDIENDKFNPAGIINMFVDEKEQSEAASLFTTKLPQLENEQEKEKALQIVDLQGFLVARPGGFEPSTF